MTRLAKIERERELEKIRGRRVRAGAGRIRRSSGPTFEQLELHERIELERYANEAGRDWRSDLIADCLRGATRRAARFDDVLCPLVRRYGALPVTAATMWIGGIGLLAVSVPAFLAQDWGAVRIVSWLAVLYSGVFAIALAYFIWYYSIRQIGNTRTAVYTNFIPIVALIIAWLMLSEVPTWLQVLGAACILVGTIMVRLGRIEQALAVRYPAD